MCRRCGDGEARRNVTIAVKAATEALQDALEAGAELRLRSHTGRRLATPIHSLHLPMPSIFPVGRCGTKRFCELAGLSRTVFLTRYRNDPYYIERFDIRVDALRRLNMSERAARAFGEERAGLRPAGRVQRVPDTPCVGCGVLIPVRARFCSSCGRRGGSGSLPRGEAGASANRNNSTAQSI